MLKTNSELRAEARKSLKGKWGDSVLPGLIYLIIVCPILISPFPWSIIGALVIPILVWGIEVGFLSQYREEGLIKIQSIFAAFDDGNFKRVASTMLLANFYLFLWCLLFYIPCIIKTLSYALTPYILKDEPELSNNAAIERSMEMMSGNKMKLFLLSLSFIGWAFLAAITVIGMIWLIPYIQTTMAAFYEDVKKNYNIDTDKPIL